MELHGYIFVRFFFLAKQVAGAFDVFGCIFSSYFFFKICPENYIEIFGFRVLNL